MRQSGRTRPKHDRRPLRSDRGFTLVELLVAVSLMGIVVVPIMTAVAATIKSSARNDTVAQVETVLQNAADRVNRAPKLCTYQLYAEAAAQYEGWDASRASVSESRYVPAALPTQNGQWVAGACEGSTPPDLLVQRVVITITSPDGRIQRTIEVVKSDV